MFVKYIKLFLQKNTSARTRVIIWSTAGGIFLVIFLAVFYYQGLADTLKKYAPDDTALYLHFNLSKINRSTAFDGLVSKILADNGLAGLDLGQINRELAVVGELTGGRPRYGLIIKFYEPQKIKQFLGERGAHYKFLSANRVVVAPEEEPLAYFVKNKKNNLSHVVCGKFILFGSIAAYLSPSFGDYLSDDLLFVMMRQALGQPDGDLFLNAKLTRNGLKIIAPSAGESITHAKKPDKSITDFDFIFSVDRPKEQLDAWADSLARNLPSLASGQAALGRLGDIYGIDLESASVQKMLGDKILFLSRKNQNNSGWFASDYDFYFSSATGDWSESEIKSLEDALKPIMARKFPREKRIRLSDGSSVVELVPDVSQFNFRDDNGATILSAPDGSAAIVYKLENGILRVTNKPELLAIDPGGLGAHHMKFNTTMLPCDGFWSYLSVFKFIEGEEKNFIFR